VDIAERFISVSGKYLSGRAGIRKDLFNFIDIVALGEKSIFGVQSCGSDFSAHFRKITQSVDIAENALKWLECGRILLIGWRKVKLHRGGKAMRWMPRIREIYEKDFYLCDKRRSDKKHEQ
jgi:hypothetical protein